MLPPQKPCPLHGEPGAAACHWCRSAEAEPVAEAVRLALAWHLLAAEPGVRLRQLEMIGTLGETLVVDALLDPRTEPPVTVWWRFLVRPAAVLEVGQAPRP